MAGALAVKVKEREKTRATSEPAPQSDAARLAVGASSGTPIFLQRAASAGSTADGSRRAPVHVHVRTAPRVQRRLTVNEPGDPFEREADAVADVVMRAPLEDGCTGGNCCATCAAKATDVQRATAPSSCHAVGGEPVATGLPGALASPDAGSPLPFAVRLRVEPRLGADLSHVRVHDDARAATMASTLHARAFTHGGDIYLGRGESRGDLRLMAHESTHVVQQGAARTDAIQRQCSSCALERSEDEPPSIQRDASDVVGDVIGDIAGGVSGAAAAVWDETVGAIDFWAILEEFAGPTVTRVLRQIEEKGIIGYLSELLSGVLDNLFGGVEDRSGPIAEVMAVFAGLLDGAQEIVTALRSGDCEPLFAAMRRMSEVVQQIAGDVWEAITDFFRPIGDFLSDLWTTYGAPIVEWIQQLAGDVWQGIQDLGNWIWEETAPARDFLSDIWDWIKSLLGVGEGVEGQQGLVQWIAKMADEAWAAIKAELAPVIEPVRELLAHVRAILPLDEIVNLRETVRAWLADTQEMIATMREPDDVAEQQDVLRDEILPAILATAEALRGGIISAGEWVGTRVGALVTAVAGFIANVRTTVILRPFAAALSWVEEGVTNLGTWVRSTVSRVFAFIGDGLVQLSRLIEPVLSVLRQVVAVIGDVVAELPGLVLGFWWNLCPACIREPIKNFIIEKILRNIPIISTFLDIPDIWARIQEQVLGFLRRVFVQGDLSGAVAAVIRFVLEAVGVNVDLFLSILQRAAGSLEHIIMHPIEFLSNLFSAIMEGAGRFARNIFTHLVTGLLGWLAGPLEDMGVQPPRELSLASIFEFVLQLLGVSGARIMRKLEEAATEVLGPRAVRAVQRVARWVRVAWDWISTLISGGWAGVWEQIQGRLAGLWETVIGGITQWISTNVVEAGIEWLAKLSNPVGWVVGAIKTIYEVLSFFARRANQILQMVDAVVTSIGDIATGAISSAAGWIENAMARSVPSVLDFLATILGIDDPAPTVRNVVESLRERVDTALDWLAERAVNMAQGIIGLFTGEGSDDVKDRAKDELLSRLSGEHTLDEAQEEVDQVFAELEPEGLLSLRIQPETEEGFYLITAEASEERRLLELMPRVEEARGKRMVMRVEITLNDEGPGLHRRQHQWTTGDPSALIGMPQSEYESEWAGRPLPQVEHRMQGPIGIDPTAGRRSGSEPGAEPYWLIGAARPSRTSGSDPHGGALFQPERQPGSVTVRLMTWNTGDIDFRNEANPSHAEHQFVTWFNSQPEGWRRRVTHIEVENDELSPCSACGPELAGMLRDLKALIGAPTGEGAPGAELTWSTQWWNGPGATRQHTLDEMSGAGWQVTPGSVAAEEESEGELVASEPRSR